MTFAHALYTAGRSQFAYGHGVSMTQEQQTAQQRFDSIYISSSEICRALSVSKSSITHARARGILPDPVVVNGAQIYLWERTKVDPFLAAWKLMLSARRRELVA